MIGCSNCNQYKKSVINCVCKDHRDKIKVPDPVVKDLIDKKKNCRTNNLKKSKADFTVREVYFSNISKGTAFLKFEKQLAPVVQRVDNFIQWISCYTADKMYSNESFWQDFHTIPYIN